MLGLTGVLSLHLQNWFMLMLGGSSIPFGIYVYNMQYIIPPGDMDANLNLPDMVIDIFTLSKMLSYSLP